MFDVDNKDIDSDNIVYKIMKWRIEMTFKHEKVGDDLKDGERICICV